MGGFGSGWRWHKKSLTNEYLALDIRHWQKEKLLQSGLSFCSSWMRDGIAIATIQATVEVGSIMLDYRAQYAAERWLGRRYPIRLDWTECHYGGRRAWFICPVSGCGRRVAILYGRSILACRHCHRLAYACQREDGWCRLLRRADKLRERLGWCVGVANGLGSKPKGMHWDTFWRLITEHDQLAIAAISLDFD